MDRRKKRIEENREKRIEKALLEKKRLENKAKLEFFIVIGFLVVICFYPFFTIQYFETDTAQHILFYNFFFPAVIIALILVPLYYIKKLKPLNPPAKTKFIRKFRDPTSCIMLLIMFTLVLNFAIFSLIICKNTYYGEQEPVYVNKPVLSYNWHRTKRFGRIKHYITFEDPKTKKVIKLHVYRKYNVGEYFSKHMYYGSLGILYSKE